MMKKILFALVLLTGCETTSQLATMSQSGAGALSCNQIQAAFRAYEADRTSLSAWVQLVEQMNPEIDASALVGEYSPEQLYTQARTYANIALAVQGCQPL